MSKEGIGGYRVTITIQEMRDKLLKEGKDIIDYCNGVLDFYNMIHRELNHTQTRPTKDKGKEKRMPVISNERV